MIKDRRARKDKEKAMVASSTASHVSVSGAGAASDRAPFCGGPAYPIDAEEAALARAWRMKKMRYEMAQFERGLGESAPAFGGDPERVTASGAATTPITTDGKVSEIESIDLDAQCVGCVVVNVTGT